MIRNPYDRRDRAEDGPMLGSANQFDAGWSSHVDADWSSHDTAAVGGEEIAAMCRAAYNRGRRDEAREHTAAVARDRAAYDREIAASRARVWGEGFEAGALVGDRRTWAALAPAVEHILSGLPDLDTLTRTVQPPPKLSRGTLYRMLKDIAPVRHRVLAFLLGAEPVNPADMPGWASGETTPDLRRSNPPTTGAAQA